MREIKFRGFNRKNNVWLYGFYLQNRGAHFVCPDEFATGKSWDDYEIDPDTRGEFTGRKDKNGKEIYEGDIVEEDIDFNSKMTDGTFRYKVCWDEDELCWSLEPIGPESIHNDLWQTNSSRRVIGNIHENKELLQK